MIRFTPFWVGACLLSACPLAMAATYTVGPGQQYTQLSTLFSQRNLAPGDVVSVRGGTTYNGGVVVGDDDSGTAASPVTIRWDGQGGSRPILQGGTNTIKFQRSNHIVFEGFDVRGGSNTCMFSEAHNVVVRNSVIRDCPNHGILGADQNSGSFTLEYSEVFNAGSGTQRHVIYMQSDEVEWPDAVFTMRYNYVHDGNGGNLVKNRHQRALIHYNWFEGSEYQEIELIGPDCYTQQSGWTPGLKREDTEIVGNVIVHTSSWPHAIRAGGDLNGRSEGRVRMANNTIVFDRGGQANAVFIQLGLGSLEMHNNVIYQTGSGAPNIVRENPASSVEEPYCAPFGREPWSSGRKVAGSNNWVQSNAANVPAEWTGTLRGSDPQLTNVAQRSLRPRDGSPLVSAGNPSPPAPGAFPFPSPLLLPAYDPPQRAMLSAGARQARNYGTRIDIGAFESTTSTPPPRRGRGEQPLLPPDSASSTGLVVQATVPGRAIGSAPAAPAPANDAFDTGTATAARAQLRIDPPLLLAWRRLRDWLDDVVAGR